MQFHLMFPNSNNGHFVCLGVGLAAGTVLSLLIFKRRMWPVHYGIGIGFGYALKDLEIALNSNSKL